MIQIRRLSRGLATNPSFWLGLLLSAGALLLSLHKVQWGAAWAAMKGIDSFLLALALSTIIATTLAKAARWASLLTPDQGPLSGILFTLVAGQLVNALIPGRWGELARVYLLGKRLGKARVLGTILVEKLLDVTMLLGLLLYLIRNLSLPRWFHSAALPLGSIAVLLLVSVTLITAHSGIQKHLSRPCPFDLKVLPGGQRLANWRHRLLESLVSMRTLRGRGKIGWALGWSLLIWTLAASTNWVLLIAFHIQQEVPPLAPVIILVAIQMGSLVPSAPAQIGVFHYLCLRSLVLFGVERDIALSYAIALHLVVYVPMAILGSIGLGHEIWTPRRSDV